MTKKKKNSLETLNHDEFERVMVYRSLTDSVYLNAIQDYLKPEYFEDKTISRYFGIVADFYHEYKKLPKAAEIRSHMSDKEAKSFKALLSSFTDEREKIDQDHLLKMTEKFLKEKSVAHNVLAVAHKIHEGEIDPAKVLSMFEESCLISLNVDTGFELFGGFERIVEDLNSTKSFISTGWEWLDKALGGGWLMDGRAFYVFAGEPNIGKSICLGNVAENIAKQGKNVLVLSFEMPELLYGKRIASNITQIEMNSFKEYQTKVTKEMASNEDKYGKIFIKEFPPSTVTPSQIAAFIKRMIEQGEEIDAIVLDYLNLVKSPIGNNSYERIKYVCEQLRAITYQFNAPMITATQLNKDGYSSKKGTPSLEHLSESSGTGATADAVISIFQQEEDMELGIIRMAMTKNRFGPRGFIQPMRVHYPTLSMIQMESEGEYDIGMSQIADEGDGCIDNIAKKSRSILDALDIMD